MPPPLRAAAGFAIRYRPMTDEDMPFMAALYASTRAEEVAATGWPEEARRHFLLQQFDAQHRYYQAQYPDAEWLVIERDGERIGRLYVGEWPAEIRVIDISLLPPSTGQGIGGAVLADVCRQAQEAGKTVAIHVEKNNPARRLYQRLGFAFARDEGVYDLMEWEGEKAAS